MQQIKVANVEIKKSTKGQEYKLVQAADFKASVWKKGTKGDETEGYDDIKPGNTLEVETFQSDKGYTNITKAVLIKSEPVVDDTRSSIERQTALKTACETLGQDAPVEAYTERADKFYEWLRGR